MRLQKTPRQKYPLLAKEQSVSIGELEFQDELEQLWLYITTRAGQKQIMLKIMPG